MKTFLVLIRGINVGGKNLIPMAGLRTFLEALGYTGVSTYIASGNVIVRTELPAAKVKLQLERELVKRFKLDDEYIKVLVLSPRQLQSVVQDKPKGFGEQPEKYHSDVLFLMDLDVARTLKIFSPREGVDQIWPGPGVIYSRRLSAQRTKSRLNKIMSAPEYKSMTIRNWNTTTTLQKLLGEMDSAG